jgi:hypothetical protein
MLTAASEVFGRVDNLQECGAARWQWSVCLGRQIGTDVSSLLFLVDIPLELEAVHSPPIVKQACTHSPHLQTDTHSHIAHIYKPTRIHT